jgi:hypothetical protein
LDNRKEGEEMSTNKKLALALAVGAALGALAMHLKMRPAAE